jgi:hypothetical protein
MCRQRGSQADKNNNEQSFQINNGCIKKDAYQVYTAFISNFMQLNSVSFIDKNSHRINNCFKKRSEIQII